MSGSEIFPLKFYYISSNYDDRIKGKKTIPQIQSKRDKNKKYISNSQYHFTCLCKYFFDCIYSTKNNFERGLLGWFLFDHDQFRVPAFGLIFYSTATKFERWLFWGDFLFDHNQFRAPAFVLFFYSTEPKFVRWILCGGFLFDHNQIRALDFV